MAKKAKAKTPKEEGSDTSVSSSKNVSGAASGACGAAGAGQDEEEVIGVRRGDPNHRFYRVPHFMWWILCIGGMTACFIISNAKEPVQALLPLDNFAMAVFGSRETLKKVFALAVIAHVVEAQIACYICMVELRLHTWHMWAVQTILLGYPSLRLLLARRRELMATHEDASASNTRETKKNK